MAPRGTTRLPWPSRVRAGSAPAPSGRKGRNRQLWATIRKCRGSIFLASAVSALDRGRMTALDDAPPTGRRDRRFQPGDSALLRHGVAKLEREKGFEPSTLCLGSTMLWRAEGSGAQPPSTPTTHSTSSATAIQQLPPVANVSNALRIGGAPGRKLVQDCVAASQR